MVEIPSGDGGVGVKIFTKVSNKKSPIAIVLSHPYGPLGGNLYNNVVWALTQHLSRFGFTTLRFNFRGVAPSEGRTSWTGNGEKEDMQAVCEYALQKLESPPEKLIVIGYSFGSVVGSAVAGEMPEVLAYVAIAYPFSVVWALTLFQHRGLLASAAQGNKPKLFVMGSQDNFTGLSTFLDRVKRLPSPIEVATVDGVDHFFFKKEAILCGLVEKWLRKVLGTEDLKAFLIKSKEASSKGLEQCLPKDVCQDGYQEL